MTSPRAPVAVLVGRNAAQLYFCFAGSALLNVLSQAFFARMAGDEKDAWLSATLLAGTLASALGVPAAQRFGLPGRTLLAGLLLVFGIAALFGGTFFLRSAAAFAGATIVLRFFLQYGTQELDRRAVLLSGEASRRANDTIGLGMRFGGMLLGPLWFGLVRDATAASMLVIASLTAFGAWTAVLVAPAPGLEGPSSTENRAKLDRTGRLLLWGARSIYASYYLLASSIIYVLSDLHRVPGAVKRGGMIVTLVYASAIAATIFEMAWGRAARRSPLEMLPAPLVMLVVGSALSFSPARMVAVQVAGAVLLGMAFARFQLAFRDHATYEAVFLKTPALLAAYNNLGTTSALLGYAVMTMLVGAARLLDVTYASIVGIGVLALGASAVPFVVASERRIREVDPTGPRSPAPGPSSAAPP